MPISKLLTDTILGNSSLETLSQKSGADKSQVEQVLSSALPILVQNMQKNASTKDGEQSLATALKSHAKADTGNIASFLQNVDIEDGGKILSHILGGSKGTVESGIAKKAGLKGNQISTILSAAAPLLLNILGSKKDEDEKQDGGGGLMGLLGSMLGGGSSNDDGKEDSGLGGLIMGGLNALFGDSGEKETEKKKPAVKKKPTAKKPTAKKPAAKKPAAKKPAAKKPAARKKKSD